jgi:hypothetical protein
MMSQTNNSIVESYFDEVINQKCLDLIPKYFSEKFVMHGSPYVGMGMMPDASSGEKVIVQKVFPGSPAEGKFEKGDVILRVVDSNRTWNTFEELRNGGLWGQGAIGTPLTVLVQRGNQEKEITLERGLVQGAEFPYELQEPGMRDMFKEWSDMKCSLVHVIESGDQVAFHARYQGQNMRYGRSAVWSEFGFIRLKDGKFTDWWSSDESVSEYRQLGFSIMAPEMVKA